MTQNLWVNERVGMQKRCKRVLRLDKILKHIKDKHPESIPKEGRSLLAMVFTRRGGDDRHNSPEMSADDDIVPTCTIQMSETHRHHSQSNRRKLA